MAWKNPLAWAAIGAAVLGGGLYWYGRRGRSFGDSPGSGNLPEGGSLLPFILRKGPSQIQAQIEKAVERIQTGSGASAPEQKAVSVKLPMPEFRSEPIKTGCKVAGTYRVYARAADPEEGVSLCRSFCRTIGHTHSGHCGTNEGRPVCTCYER